MIYQKLPSNLNINFKELFNLRPDKRSDVTIFDKQSKEYKNKTIFRSYNSYLKTPEFDETVKKSYMFLNKAETVPNEFKPFVELAQNLDPRYNQMVVNWYDEKDFIEFHRDCTNKMVYKDCPILTINLNESDDIYKARHLTFQNVENGELSSVPLLNKHYYIINNNSTHRHSVGMGTEKRISLTFRMMK